MRIKLKHDITEPLPIFPAVLTTARIHNHPIYDIHALQHVVLLHPSTLNALEIINIIESLSSYADELTELLLRSCGTCENCPFICPYLDTPSDALISQEDTEALSGTLACAKDISWIIPKLPDEYTIGVKKIPAFCLGWLQFSNICFQQLNNIIAESRVLYDSE